MNIITKKDALAKKMKYYFTGKPCKHGHVSERMVKGGACKQCRDIFSLKYRNENRQVYNEYCRIKKKESYSKEKRRTQYVNNIIREMYHAAKTRAKNKNIPFTITIKDVIMTEKCPVFNIPFDYENKMFSPTLDRINNELGYIPGNVKVISAKANRLKSNGTIQDFLKIIEYIKNA
jgi:hypothetical protein